MEFLVIPTTNEISFLHYWDIIQEKKINSGFSGKEEIRRLNKARVALKHHGIFSSKIEIEGFRINSTNFFLNSTLQSYLGFLFQKSIYRNSLTPKM